MNAASSHTMTRAPVPRKLSSAGQSGVVSPAAGSTPRQQLIDEKLAEIDAKTAQLCEDALEFWWTRAMADEYRELQTVREMIVRAAGRKTD